jgi:hypothetical protein
MRRAAGGYRPLAFFVILMTGIVFGGIITYLTRDAAALSWLSVGYALGLEQPVVLDIYIMKLTFGIAFNINVATIIGLAFASLCYRFIF